MAEKVPLREDLFRESGDGGTLLGNQCASCRKIFFPKAQICFECGHEDLAEVQLNRRGILYSYTIGHMPSLHFVPPYAVGYIDLPEEVRVFAPLVTIEQTPFAVGMEMELIIERLWEEGDKEVIGYKFKPV